MVTEKQQVTFESEVEGLIWRENINGPINWFLEEVNKTGRTNGGMYYHKSFGSVEKTWNGKFKTCLPALYDEETDSDAYSVGEFETKEGAFKAVEKAANLSLYF